MIDPPAMPPTVDPNRVTGSRLIPLRSTVAIEPFSLNGSELTAEFGDGATFTSEEAAALAIFDCGRLAL